MNYVWLSIWRNYSAINFDGGAHLTRPPFIPRPLRSSPGPSVAFFSALSARGSTFIRFSRSFPRPSRDARDWWSPSKWPTSRDATASFTGNRRFDRNKAGGWLLIWRFFIGPEFARRKFPTIELNPLSCFFFFENWCFSMFGDIFVRRPLSQFWILWCFNSTRWDYLRCSLRICAFYELFCCSVQCNWKYNIVAQYLFINIDSFLNSVNYQ